jgi:hypothetical protein
MVILGFIHYYDLGSEINLALNFHDSRIGNEIAKEISVKIFDPVKSLLEKNYSPLLDVSPESDFIDDLIQKLKELNKNLNQENKEPPKPITINKSSLINEIKIPEKTSEDKKDFIVKKFIINEEVFPKKTQEKISSPLQNINQPSENFINKKPFEDLKIPKPVSNIDTKQKTIDSLNAKPTTPPPQQFPTFKSETKTINPKLSQIPTPVFIHKEENLTPIKSGIENKIPEVKISEIKPPPPPPQKAKIEIGIKPEDSKIKVVNYSGFEEKPNISKPQTQMPPEPPKPFNIPKPPQSPKN